MIRGVRVDFSSSIVNAIYGLSNIDNWVYKERYRELGAQWLVDKLHDKVPPKYFTSHRGIESYEFTVKARYWFSIICACVIPSTYDTEVTVDYTLVIDAILDGV